MEEMFLRNIDAILDKTKEREIGYQIRNLVDLCCADPGTVNLTRASNVINLTYVRIDALRRAIIETLEPVYGKWGDEPDERIRELWKRLHGNEPSPISEECRKRLKQIKCLMSLLCVISSAVDSAKVVPDLFFNRSERKRYLEQDAVRNAFDDIQKC